MQPKLGAARRILETIEKVYPNYHTDRDMNVHALMGLAPVIGAVAVWILRNRGDAALDKALAAILTEARKQTYEMDALLRTKDRLG